MTRPHGRKWFARRSALFAAKEYPVRAAAQ